MFPGLKNHPFAVEAFFDYSIVLTFALPKAQLQALLPPCLELDTLQDQYGFIAVAMVQTKHLRPKGFPKFMGNDFFLIGYRIFVKYTNSAGKRLRGLYILKSETDKKKMAYLGNFFTHYNYTSTRIKQSQSGSTSSFESPDFKVFLDLAEDAVPLPAHSPFTDWKEARRFAGPLPFTFQYNAKTKKVLIIEGLRENWTPRPIKVMDYHFSFLTPFHHIVLANAFIINNIPYHWKKGKLETWR
ncbi:DUF2071 domain-containing protein [Chitinophaga silvisoli]|uniref:DUF2071 domain-containing protein n=1 Tax=Chitinophaga silvisoli TaxID=2291814 RepID=A0A3E1PA57_9BACT|nr:DUF2071 domain-containing protein [Chitinophaga silvisoli]RFM37007.1 hypothetical protein DXN04_05785 [Chitinophaga silvisoli]